MNFSFFIKRPILASVIALIIMMCGLVAVFNLPVEQYPRISPLSIVVSARYPGASAETIEKSITTQFENKLNGISNVLYMSSHSTSNGSVSVRLTFEVGTNLNFALNEVLNRVQAAMPLLPGIVQQLGVTVRKSAPDMLMTLDFYNEGGNLDEYYLSNYLQRTVYNDLNLVPGVGQVNLYGHTYAMRIWLDVNKMMSLNVSPQDIATAIKQQSHEYVIGHSGSQPLESSVLTFNLSGGKMYSSPQQFKNIVLRNDGVQFVRIKDVARVELGASSYNVMVQANFRQHKRIQQEKIVALQIFMDPSANQLAVKQRVLQRLAEDAKDFPPGLKYKVSFDATQFVSASIDNVVRALRDASLLVGIVAWVFLQNWRASLIALVTIPVSVLGSFTCLYLLGSSLNTLTLFALILAIGIVVDDAIVVVENIARLKATHPNLPIKHIVELALAEVFSAIIAIALVLSIVFLPVMGLGGLSGVLYRQFALTIACTVIISALTALTLTPALSGLFLTQSAKITKVGQHFNQLVTKATQFYVDLAEKIIDWGRYSLLGLLLVSSVALFMYKLIPLSFVPNEDQGYFLAA
ncbi:MAG: efflux RND transporter permease subunit, partial [Burkholderiales bacterium]